ncbi:PLP-dependent aminotransferase family protein [Actinokineospora sp. PR83]|uniref:aminotransferase-like domain-containing protein n=1 Tax=Actinokineospora sp. PR83 TaxID=2884908 RepID=UPI001F178BC0|nr:PLP-dependent aminotransferase family protein [Actinokineospora sp. PR83]MCG8915953.1 PLP-dependent aminotransferase family protein [Actinokineospora sp. PR83]
MTGLDPGPRAADPHPDESRTFGSPSADPRAVELRAADLRLAELHHSLSDPLLSAMTFLNEVTARFPEAISFAPGRPHEKLFDPDSIAENLAAYRDHLHAQGLDRGQVRTALFQYGRTKGQIHDLIARTVANDEGIHVPADAVVVTVGAQEGMLLVLRALFADPGDVLLVASPCYVGITGAARLLGIPLEPVPETDAGPDAGRVAEAIGRVRAAGRRPRALYLVPDFANPSGASMSVAQRERLLALAAAEGVLVIEDNPYGFFTGADVRTPTLKALDRERSVVHIGSFAKTCFPGARLGYVLADQRVVAADGSTSLLADALAQVKSMTTVNTPSLSQAVIGGLLVRSGCRLREANAEGIAFYRRNMALLLAELGRHFPPGSGVRWNTPAGGFFAVLTVPFAADAAALEVSAREFGVLWTPMDAFHLDGGGRDRLRLSCSYVDPEELVEGVRRLAAFIRSR